MRLETGVVRRLPLRETRIGALSSACGRRARFANAQALLAISAMLNPAQRAHGFNPPKEPEVPVPLVLTAARSGEKIRWFSEKFFDKLLLLAYNRINGFVDYAVIRKWKVKGTQFPSGVWGSAPMHPLKEAL